MATTTTNLGLTKPDYTDAADIAVINTNMDTVDTAITATKSDLGIVEDGNTATHSITAGQYVIWKGNLYTASSAIATGTTLSTSNLTAVSNGGLNSLNDHIANCITGEYYTTGYNSTGSDWETVKQIDVPANSMFIGSITSGFYNSSYLGARILVNGLAFAESGTDKPASCSFFTGENAKTVKLQTKHSGAGVNNTWVSYAYIKL